MRISDWSSDVCSSDLADTAAENIEQQADVIEERAGTMTNEVVENAMENQAEALENRAEGVREMGERQGNAVDRRSEEHTSELQSLMRISYAVFCLKKKKQKMNESQNNMNTREP